MRFDLLILVMRWIRRLGRLFRLPCSVALWYACMGWRFLFTTSRFMESQVACSGLLWASLKSFLLFASTTSFNFNHNPSHRVFVLLDAYDAVCRKHQRQGLERAAVWAWAALVGNAAF